MSAAAPVDVVKPTSKSAVAVAAADGATSPVPPAVEK